MEENNIKLSAELIYDSGGRRRKQIRGETVITSVSLMSKTVYQRWQKSNINQCLHSSNGLEFEDNDGKNQRRNFATYFSMAFSCKNNLLFNVF